MVTILFMVHEKEKKLNISNIDKEFHIHYVVFPKFKLSTFQKQYLTLFVFLSYKNNS